MSDKNQTISLGTLLPVRGNRQSFNDVITDIDIDGLDQSNFDSSIQVTKVGTDDPDTANEITYNTDKRLHQIFLNGASRKVNMFKEPMLILDGESYSELIRLGGEVDADKDGTAEFASTDISTTQQKQGLSSMKFDSAQELVFPMKDKFNVGQGTLSLWVYSADISKSLYQNNAGFKLSTDSSGFVVFSITESAVTGSAKTVNTVTGSSDITSASWFHVTATWSGVNSGSANATMTLYVGAAVEGSAISGTKIDVAGVSTNQVIGAGINDPSWSTSYDGNVEPDSDGWTLSGTDQSSVSGGILTIDTIGDNVTNAYTKAEAATTAECMANLEDAEAGAHFEFRVKKSGGPDTAVRLFPGQIQILSATSDIVRIVPLDTTKYHVYRFAGATSAISWYVDNVLVFSGTDSSGGGDEVRFGDPTTTNDIKANISYVRYEITSATTPIGDQCTGFVDELGSWNHTMDLGEVVGIFNAGETLYDYYEINKTDYLRSHSLSVVASNGVEKSQGITSATQADLNDMTLFVNSPGDIEVDVMVNLEFSSDNVADQIQTQIALDGLIVTGERTQDIDTADSRRQITYTFPIGLQTGVRDIAVQANNDGTNTLTIWKGTVTIREVK